MRSCFLDNGCAEMQSTVSAAENNEKSFGRSHISVGVGSSPTFEVVRRVTENSRTKHVVRMRF